MSACACASCRVRRGSERQARRCVTGDDQTANTRTWDVPRTTVSPPTCEGQWYNTSKNVIQTDESFMFQVQLQTAGAVGAYGKSRDSRTPHL